MDLMISEPFAIEVSICGLDEFFIQSGSKLSFPFGGSLANRNGH